jgi:hypothetical protein
MGLELHGREQNRYRFQVKGSAAPGAVYDVLVDPQASPGRPGAGTVHLITKINVVGTIMSL